MLPLARILVLQHTLLFRHKQIVFSFPLDVSPTFSVLFLKIVVLLTPSSILHIPKKNLVKSRKAPPFLLYHPSPLHLLNSTFTCARHAIDARIATNYFRCFPSY
uniref:SJCHGC06752 protein n=1 Tax=Schistosoma japonicum TaxID=6182 RepID=Q5D9M6_SCHJA|nr:SJCHGC06752 protein [Schistosoma japonicum]